MLHADTLARLSAVSEPLAHSINAHYAHAVLAGLWRCGVVGAAMRTRRPRTSANATNRGLRHHGKTREVVTAMVMLNARDARAHQRLHVATTPVNGASSKLFAPMLQHLACRSAVWCDADLGAMLHFRQRRDEGHNGGKDAPAAIAAPPQPPAAVESRKPVNAGTVAAAPVSAASVQAEIKRCT